jgi:hypothetical protein
MRRWIRGEAPDPPPDLTEWERPLHQRISAGMAPIEPERVDVAIRALASRSPEDSA